MNEAETETAASPEEDSPPVEPSNNEDQPIEEVPTEEMDTDTAVEESEGQTASGQVEEEVTMAGSVDVKRESGIIQEVEAGPEQSSHQPEAMEVTANEEESVSQQQETNITAAIETPAEREPSQIATVSTPPVDEPVELPTDFPPVVGNVDHTSVTQSNTTLESAESITSAPIVPDTQPQTAEIASATAADTLSPAPVITAPTSDYFSATDSAKEEDSNTAVADTANEEGPPPSNDVIEVIPEDSATNEQGQPLIIGPPHPLFEEKLMEAATQPNNDAQQKDVSCYE